MYGDTARLGLFEEELVKVVAGAFERVLLMQWGWCALMPLRMIAILPGLTPYMAREARRAKRDGARLLHAVLGAADVLDESSMPGILSWPALPLTRLLLASEGAECTELLAFVRPSCGAVAMLGNEPSSALPPARSSSSNHELEPSSGCSIELPLPFLYFSPNPC